MLTVTELASTCGISRSTLLYYERHGLLAPALRSENGYRWYSENERRRLQDIIRYRSFGIAVTQIKPLLDHDSAVCQSEILKTQFNKLESHINELRKQQSAIVALLQQPQLLEKNMVTKERWTEIMQAAGFSNEDMLNWHKSFEKMEPTEHQLFLESLGIKELEIKKIRSL